jgi:hypothetical protein
MYITSSVNLCTLSLIYTWYMYNMHIYFGLSINRTSSCMYCYSNHYENEARKVSSFAPVLRSNMKTEVHILSSFAPVLRSNMKTEVHVLSSKYMCMLYMYQVYIKDKVHKFTELVIYIIFPCLINFQ